MVSLELIGYCLVAAGGYLLLVTLALELIGRQLRLTADIPAEMMESATFSWSLVNFVMESMFYVAIPTVIYSFFYFLIPFSGIKAGLAAALFAFTVGAAPVMMGLSVRVKLPMPYLLFILLSMLIKMSGSLAIIGYLYSL